MTTTRSEPTSTPTANGNFVVDPATLVGARPAEPAPATQTCELSIVLPCLNEAETLATCIRKAQRSLESLGVVGEVVIADNGSTDGSQEIARAAGARVSGAAQGIRGRAARRHRGGARAVRPHGRRRRQLRPR